MPESVTGAVLAAVSAVILLGGLKRVAAVAERLVPAMALLYIVGALTVWGCISQLSRRRLPPS